MNFVGQIWIEFQVLVNGVFPGIDTGENPVASTEYFSVFAPLST